MNGLFIKSATLVLPTHPLHLKAVDMIIEKGRIIQLATTITSANEKLTVIDAAGQILAPGFFDLNANFGEPGLETKEDILTGTAAAAAGGFTGVAVHPNTQPAIQSSAEVSLLINKAQGALVSVHPIGAISHHRAGEKLAELYDMKLNGAVAFSDGNHSVQQAGLMSRALLYSRGFGGLVISFPQDSSVSGDGQMNEGITSTYLGMKGNPNLSEALMVSRDLHLAEYNDAGIHFTTISTAESVDLIKKAKAKGIQVTCDVAAHHLVFTDELVKGFDSHYKVSPPLRTKADVKALLKGLKDGTIDAIVSQHTPHEIEFKNVEFHIAKNGIIGLQTVLPLLLKAGLTSEQIVEKLALGPRKILGLAIPALAEGEEANLVLFDPNKKWIFDEQTNRSKSTNSPLFGEELLGQVTIVANNRQIFNNRQ